MSPTNTHTTSPTQKALRRLLKNKPAILGMVLIGLAVIIATLGYAITPDSTPNANDQVNEINLKPPGFSVPMLKVRKNREVPQRNFFGKMLYGAENPYKLVPMSDYNIDESHIYVEVYSEDETLENTSVFDLADVVYPLSVTNPEVLTAKGVAVFQTIDNQQKTAAAAELKSQIEDTHVYMHTYHFGTDGLGRCLLSRLLIGIRVSLAVGLLAVLISLTIGITLGAIAGYFGGRTDDFIMLIINTMWSIPTLLLVFALVLALGRGFWQIFVAVGLTMWVDVARIVRGQVMSLREIQFVEAANSLGFSDGRIIRRHILPNILGPVMVVAAANFAIAILIEAGLSYLGFGIQPPTPSWGTMLAENYSFLLKSNNPFPAIVPGLAIMLMVLAFNLVGNGFRDALDVKTRLNH